MGSLSLRTPPLLWPPDAWALPWAWASVTAEKMGALGALEATIQDKAYSFSTMLSEFSNGAHGPCGSGPA